FAQKRIPVFYLLTLICILVVLLTLMFYILSHFWSDYNYGDSFFYVKKLNNFCVLGLVFMFIIIYILFINIIFYMNYILCNCFILLIIVLITGIGIVRGGAQSWIGIGAFSIQPAEFMKLGLILFLAAYFTNNHRYMSTFTHGFLIPMFLVTISFGLIMVQPD